jgi:hypothetical protein
MPKQAIANTRPRFLDTSCVIWQLHGHALQEAAVREALGEGVAQVSNFIRMEYLHGVVINLIELYFLIKEADSGRGSCLIGHDSELPMV